MTLVLSFPTVVSIRKPLPSEKRPNPPSLLQTKRFLSPSSLYLLSSTKGQVSGVVPQKRDKYRGVTIGCYSLESVRKSRETLTQGCPESRVRVIILVEGSGTRGIGGPVEVAKIE